VSASARVDARVLHILAVSGSLRSTSKNRSLLEAARLLAPARVRISLDWTLAKLPHFNPDLDVLDESALPDIAAKWRERVGEADGLLISSPEYAHGIPGVLKNALDWLVSSTTFPGKPVALLCASTMSMIAPAQLREILTTMNSRFVDDASISIGVPSGADAATIAADTELAPQLRSALEAFVRAIDESR
jgi:chromate reductase